MISGVVGALQKHACRDEMIRKQIISKRTDTDCDIVANRRHRARDRIKSSLSVVFSTPRVHPGEDGKASDKLSARANIRRSVTPI